MLGRTQAYVSQQLRVLREADVVIDEKDGLNVYYRIVNPRVLQLMEVLMGPAKPSRSVPPVLVQDAQRKRCVAVRDKIVLMLGKKIFEF